MVSDKDKELYNLNAKKKFFIDKFNKISLCIFNKYEILFPEDWNEDDITNFKKWYDINKKIKFLKVILSKNIFNNYCDILNNNINNFEFDKLNKEINIDFYYFNIKIMKHINEFIKELITFLNTYKNILIEIYKNYENFINIDKRISHVLKDLMDLSTIDYFDEQDLIKTNKNYLTTYDYITPNKAFFKNSFDKKFNESLNESLNNLITLTPCNLNKYLTT